MDTNKLSHTAWECKYHIVFAPKYRRKIIYGKIREDIGKILRELCDRKGVEIIEAECCPDHVHMFVATSPEMAPAKLIQVVKSITARKVFERFPGIKRMLCSSLT